MDPRMNTEWRSRNQIVLVLVLVLVIEPRHPIEDEDENEDDEEKFARRAKILRDSSTKTHHPTGPRVPKQQLLTSIRYLPAFPCCRRHVARAHPCDRASKGRGWSWAFPCRAGRGGLA